MRASMSPVGTRSSGVPGATLAITRISSSGSGPATSDVDATLTSTRATDSHGENHTTQMSAATTGTTMAIARRARLIRAPAADRQSEGRVVRRLPPPSS